MNSRATVTILAILVLASLGSCANQPPSDTQPQEQLVEDTAFARASPDDAQTIVNLGGVFLDRFQARRSAVLSLWVDGEPVDRIAAKTGYKVEVVITTIENYRDDYRKHEDQLDELVYPEYLTGADRNAGTN